jgi:predicted deacylase
LVSDADAAVDLHTGTADMLEHVRVGEGASAARTLAEAFGTEVVLLEESQAAADDATTGGTAATSDDRDGTDPEAGVAGHEPRTPPTGGKFRTVATRAGIPAVTAELSNSRRVARPAAETGVEGVCNVLRSLDVMGGPPRRPETQTLLCADAPPTLATESGLFEPRPDLAVGEAVEGGAPVGALYDPSSFDRLETVTAEAGGTVYSITRESVVVAGERLVAVASRE